jgi:alkylation response protein AidB-like acyl-CoA dehydrogenase
MAAAGLYRTSVARSYGGYEADPATSIRMIETVSEADGAAGWNIMIANETSGIASGALGPEGGREVFASPEVIMAGALNPLGRARPVEGGWVVNGRWPYASGCQNADWFWGGCTVVDAAGEIARRPDGTAVVLQSLFPKAEFIVHDTWQVAGIRGSGSHDLEVRDAFVPAYRTTNVYGTAMRETGPLFRYPVFSRLCYNKVGVATGIARAAIDGFVELARAKTPFMTQSLLRERAQAQLSLAEAEATLLAGRAFLFEAIAEMWDVVCREETPSMEARVRQRLAASHAVVSACRAVDLVHEMSGATANFLASPIERQFRDVHVVRAHTTVSPAFYETAGRALFGEPLAPGSY